jgi:hypothetical protein
MMSERGKVLHVLVLWNLPFILYLFNVVDVFEYRTIIVLNCDVFFRYDFSPYKCVRSNFLATMEVLNASVSLNALEGQDMYV